MFAEHQVDSAKNIREQESYHPSSGVVEDFSLRSFFIWIFANEASQLLRNSLFADVTEGPRPS